MSSFRPLLKQVSPNTPNKTTPNNNNKQPKLKPTAVAALDTDAKNEGDDPD